MIEEHWKLRFDSWSWQKEKQNKNLLVMRNLHWLEMITRVFSVDNMPTFNKNPCIKILSILRNPTKHFQNKFCLAVYYISSRPFIFRIPMFHDQISTHRESNPRPPEYHSDGFSWPGWWPVVLGLLCVHACVRSCVCAWDRAYERERERHFIAILLRV